MPRSLAIHREGLGFPPDPLDAGAQALENMPRLECVRGAALLFPMLSMYLPEMHREMQGIGHQQSDHTFHQRRWNSLEDGTDGMAQMVKADPRSYCPSDVRLHDGTACLLLRAIHTSGNGSTGWVTAIFQISAKGSTDSKKCRDPVNTSRCAHREDPHRYPSQHHPISPQHRHTHCTEAQHSRASGAQSHSLCAPEHSAICFQMHKLPLLIFLYLEFAEFLSILLCLPSNFPGRRYSRGENKLPHLLLCTSCTLTWLLNPIHRHHALQTCGHPSCEVSEGCC